MGFQKQVLKAHNSKLLLLMFLPEFIGHFLYSCKNQTPDRL